MLIMLFFAYEWDSLSALPDTIDYIRDVYIVKDRIFAGVNYRGRKVKAGILYLDTLEGVWHSIDTFFVPISPDNKTSFTSFYYDTTINRLFATVSEERLPGPYHYYHFAYSDDMGSTWTYAIVDSGYGIDKSMEIKRLSNGNLYATGGVNYSDDRRNGRIYISKDNGETWSLWKKTPNGEAGEFQFILEPEPGVIWTASDLGRSYNLYEDTLGREGDLLVKSVAISGIYMMVKRENDYIASMSMSPHTQASKIYVFDGEDDWIPISQSATMYTDNRLAYNKKDSLTLYGFYDENSVSLLYYMDLSNTVVKIDSVFNGYGLMGRLRVFNDGRVAVSLYNENSMMHETRVYITKPEKQTEIMEKSSPVPILIKDKKLYFNGAGSYSIYNEAGELVVNTTRRELSLKDFSEGIYFVKYVQNHKQMIKRIVIIK